jgi:isopentenyldiphosphate isomerase
MIQSITKYFKSYSNSQKMTEYFDWVDRHDHPIGVASREDAHRLQLFHRAVHLYAKGTNGGIILQKRSLLKDVEPGLWTVSCSGHVDHEESYEEAAKREMVEELGVSIEDDQFRTLLHSDPSPENGYEFVRSYEVLGTIDPQPDPTEISDVCEMALTELDQWLMEKPHQFASSFRALFPLARKRFLEIT